MKKRYQVFISSTFEDLREVRGRVIEAAMKLGFIPASMEFFTAMDEEQFRFIKSVIDDCDYYVVIVAGRYGSVTEEGISFTEKEYDYAVERGVPVLAFVHEAPSQIAVAKTDVDPKLKERLDQFRIKLKKGRIVRMWKDEAALCLEVALSLSQAREAHPAEGWVRGGDVLSSDVLLQLNNLRVENEKLKSQTMESAAADYAPPNGLAFGPDKTKISGSYFAHHDRVDWSRMFTIDEVFSLIGPEVIAVQTQSAVKKALEHKVYEQERPQRGPMSSFTIKASDLDQIGLHFHALRLITISANESLLEGSERSWKITPGGFTYLTTLLAIRKSAN